MPELIFEVSFDGRTYVFGEMSELTWGRVIMEEVEVGGPALSDDNVQVFLGYARADDRAGFGELAACFGVPDPDDFWRRTRAQLGLP